MYAMVVMQPKIAYALEDTNQYMLNPWKKYLEVK